MSTPDREFTAEARAIDIMVWVDGVEVPFNEVEVNYQMDNPSRCAISIEPDEVLELWRPKSRVHVWVRDPFPDGARVPFDGNNPEDDQRDEDFDQDTYMLFWEGEIVSINDTETADTRQTTITAEDYWNIPINTNINLVDIGAGLKVAFINGSTFYGDIASDSDGLSADTSNLILGGMINYLFKEGDKAFRENGSTNKIDSGVTEIGRQLMLYLANFNASYGLQAWRSNMFEKFTGIPDRSMQNFLRFSLLPTLMGQVQQNQVSPDVFSYLGEMISKFFHHTVTVPFPPLKKQLSNGRNSSVDSWGELAIVPNLYYAFAPLCNWLFPEHYTQRSVGRDFMAEPTRLGMSSVSTSTAGFRTVHLAPEGLVSYLNSQATTPLVPDGADPLTLDRLHGSRGKSVPVTKQSDIEFEKRGFYLDPGVGRAERVNLLKFLTPEELEKGILYTESQNAYQEFLGLARLNISKDGEDDAKNRMEKKARDKDAYTEFMRMLAQYELNFKQVSRHTQITGIFNPWPVPGLPMMVCREGRSYKGLLVGLSHRISYGGGASTSYELAYTQLFRPASLRESRSDDDFQKAKTGLKDASEIQQSEYKELLDDLVERKLITREEADALLASGVGDIQATLNELRDDADETDSDMTKESEAFETVRNSAGTDTSTTRYGTEWFDSVDNYAGYVHGMIGESVVAKKTSVPVIGSQPSPDEYLTGLGDGQARPDDVKAVVIDQLNAQEITVSLWPEISQPSGGQVSTYWAEVIRPYRLIYEELRAAVDALAPSLSTDTEYEGYLLATTTSVMVARNQRVIAFEQAVRDVQNTAKAEIAAVNETIARFNALIADRQAYITELNLELASTILPRSASRIRQDIATAEQNIADLEINITLEENKIGPIEAEAEEAERQLQAAIDQEPHAANWDWQETLRDALVMLNRDDPTSSLDQSIQVSFSDFQTSFSGSSFVTWDQLFSANGISNGSTTVPRLKALFDQLQAGYLKYHGEDLSGIIYEQTTLLNRMVLAYKAATDFTFNTRLDRFMDLSGDVMEKITENYKLFKKFLSEIEMELPPLMPFSNDSLTRLDAFDEAVEGMVKPREAEGTFAHWADDVAAIFTGEEVRTNQVFRSLRQEVALRYDAYVRMARKIFPFAEGDNDAEYRRQTDKGTQTSWANKIQAREGVSMREFLDRTGLQLESRSATDPDTFGKGTYYVARAVGDPETTDLNSYFSKLGRLPEGDFTNDFLGESLEEIREKARRGTAPDWQFIKASVRQNVVEEYTKKHAVARAFRGKR